MRDSYSSNCDYGGFGNYQEEETACLICPHATECAYETEQAELADVGLASRRRSYGSWRRPQRSSGYSGISTTTPTQELATRRRSRRPLPLPGESAITRMIKNAGASMLSAGFHELGDFWDMHDFAATDDRTGKVITPPRKKE